MERVLLYQEALAEILAYASHLPALSEVDTVALADTPGRVLAQPLIADRNQPPFPRSTRDGFAVRSEDLHETPEPLLVLGSIRAGERWTGEPLEEKQAIEIMTGAPVPHGADAVLMVEHIESVAPGQIRPQAGRTLRAGENVVPAGAEAQAGAELVPSGRRLATPEISLAASCGYTHLEVFAQPRVALVATGDELVEVGSTPQSWQIRNSNSFSLGALVQAERAVARRLPIARDTLDDLRERIRQGLAAELLLFSGGVSMGKYDLVEQALDEAGAEFFFTGARIQPGKPVVFGRLPRPHGGYVPFFGLPGNPISTEVCFRLFVTPLLRALAGDSDRQPRFAEARLAEDVRGGAKVTRFLPAILAGDWTGVSVRPVPWQGSGDLAANARANCFVVLPMEQDRFVTGDTMRVLLR